MPYVIYTLVFKLVIYSGGFWSQFQGFWFNLPRSKKRFEKWILKFLEDFFDVKFVKTSKLMPLGIL